MISASVPYPLVFNEAGLNFSWTAFDIHIVQSEIVRYSITYCVAGAFTVIELYVQAYICSNSEDSRCLYVSGYIVCMWGGNVHLVLIISNTYEYKLKVKCAFFTLLKEELKYKFECY
jgi:hypothetical protein